MSDIPATPEILCRRCKMVLDSTDNYCRRCGLPTSPAPAVSLWAGTARQDWWGSPWVVLPLLFVVLGPLALPLLWRSRQFSQFWKIALTVIVVVGTIYLLWWTWHTMNQLLAPLLDVFPTHP